MLGHELRSMKVAERLAAVIADLGGTAESAAQLSEDDWGKVVYLAHLNEMNAAVNEDREVEWEPSHGYLPSKMTRQYVYARLLWGVTGSTAMSMPEPDTDVFAGLPGVDD